MATVARLPKRPRRAFMELGPCGVRKGVARATGVAMTFGEHRHRLVLHAQKASDP